MSQFTISLTAKKATRKAAYGLVIKLKHNQSLTDEQMDSLLLYFAPSAPKVAKTAIEWVAKAAAKNDVRYYLNYIRVQDGYAYATDGHRMHRAVSDLPTGFYCPITLAQVDCDATYPDPNRVMTRLSNVKPYVTDLTLLTKGVSHKTNYLLKPDIDIAVKESYLMTALNGQDDLLIEYEPYNSGYRIHGDNQFGTYIIMPMKEY